MSSFNRGDCFFPNAGALCFHGCMLIGYVGKWFFKLINTFIDTVILNRFPICFMDIIDKIILIELRKEATSFQFVTLSWNFF